MKARIRKLVEAFSRANPRLRLLAARTRPFLVLNHLLHRPELAETGQRYRELGVGKRWFSLVKHAEVKGLGSEVARLDRDNGTEELRGEPRFGELPEGVRSGLEKWPAKGYLVAEGLIDRDRLARLNADIDGLLASGDLHEHHISPRFMNVHRTSAAAAEVADDPAILDILELILGRRARLFQTICFMQGSQQEAHSDAFHMMTEPPGFLVGVWVALEDITDDSGPVFYLPGSHRFPYVMSEDLDLPAAQPLLTTQKGDAYLGKMQEMTARAGEPEHFTARGGDVLFWHHNLLHGGSGIGRPGSTRRSLVGHYFAEGVLCYHEVTERPALLPAEPVR